MYDDLSGCRKEGCLKCSLSVSLSVHSVVQAF